MHKILSIFQQMQLVIILQLDYEIINNFSFFSFIKKVLSKNHYLKKRCRPEFLMMKAG